MIKKARKQAKGQDLHILTDKMRGMEDEKRENAHNRPDVMRRTVTLTSWDRDKHSGWDGMAEY